MLLHVVNNGAISEGDSGLSHVRQYASIWVEAIGEELECERELINAVDRYAVAAVRSVRWQDVCGL